MIILEIDGILICQKILNGLLFLNLRFGRLSPMHKITTLKNGLILITVDIPYLDSVTTMIAVKAGSRYETKKISGISHFLEHMFFKGSKKYPTAEIMANLVDGIGAINNAGTDKEFTYYWIKSAAKHVEFASDMLSSMVKEPLLVEEEIEKEKGVIVEELRMFKDTPSRYVWDLYEKLQLGDQPVGWDIGGDEKTVKSLKRDDFVNYIKSLYNCSNMAVIYAGKLPGNIKEIAENNFSNLPNNKNISYAPFKSSKQIKPRVNAFYKKTDQANLILGVAGFDRNDPRRYAARVLGIILGEGMSSRLFREVREKRGLAYHVAAFHNPFQDAGYFAAYAGLKLEKIEEGLKVIRTEMLRTATEKVTAEELKKAKEMERGRIALRSESTNFLAEYFGVNFVLDRKIETFDEYLRKIDAVTLEDVQNVACELFQKNKFNLQIIGPFKNSAPFEKILNS
ncbi:MAG: pitrilysin family protein [Candidatus Daviesbacteria bacterium]|nr:pitrilysin family protein [Candidatus Daviesbacteria bacterium]